MKKTQGCCCIPECNRRFYTKQEQKQQLQEYKKELEKEIKGIEKTMQEL